MSVVVCITVMMFMSMCILCAWNRAGIQLKKNRKNIMHSQLFEKYAGCDIIALAVSPERGCISMTLISFLLSVMASVVAYYICKWLDGDK